MCGLIPWEGQEEGFQGHLVTLHIEMVHASVRLANKLRTARLQRRPLLLLHWARCTLWCGFLSTGDKAEVNPKNTPRAEEQQYEGEEKEKEGRYPNGRARNYMGALCNCLISTKVCAPIFELRDPAHNPKTAPTKCNGLTLACCDVEECFCSSPVVSPWILRQLFCSGPLHELTLQAGPHFVVLGCSGSLQLLSILCLAMLAYPDLGLPKSANAKASKKASYKTEGSNGDATKPIADQG